MVCACAPAQLPAVRNVVLISLDTLRADHLSLYGYHRPTSPALDEFAKESIVFDAAVAPAPNTAPSQMSLLTSLIFLPLLMRTRNTGRPDGAKST